MGVLPDVWYNGESNPHVAIGPGTYKLTLSLLRHYVDLKVLPSITAISLFT